MGANRQSLLMKVSKLQKIVQASFNTLFQTPIGGELEVREFDHRIPVQLFKSTLQAVSVEVHILQNKETTHISQSPLTSPDSIDYLNLMMRRFGTEPLSEVLMTGVLDMMTEERLFVIDEDTDIHEDSILSFQLKHAEILLKEGVELLKTYFEYIISENTTDALRIRPGYKEFLLPGSFNADPKSSSSLAETLRAKAIAADPFRQSKVFRYSGNDFIPADLVSIRPVSGFFGYNSIRDLFQSYFTEFSKKGENLPLLISSLPGLGKTQFTISYTMAFDELTLILPEPGDLERPLETIISRLSKRKNRKFVVFFDDVDTRKIDWYHFRTLVGGSFALPENISIVIASNYEFPANISSRGRGVVFPMFDEITCQEMVTDFLKFMGMKNPSPSLVAVIASDYVEEFGQHAFEELSPRTLVRYLEKYNTDTKKRMKMLEMSRSELVPQPDSQVFYEANIKVTERLNNS